MNGQTKPMINAMVTGKRKSHQKCRVDLIWELGLKATLLLFIFFTPCEKENGIGCGLRPFPQIFRS